MRSGGTAMGIYNSTEPVMDKYRLLQGFYIVMFITHDLPMGTHFSSRKRVEATLKAGSSPCMFPDSRLRAKECRILSILTVPVHTWVTSWF